MPNDYGINIYRRESGITAPRTARSALACFVGVAPMNGSEPVTANELSLCWNMKQFEARFGIGKDTLTWDLWAAANIMFNVFSVAPVAFCSVLDVKNDRHVAAKSSNVGLRQRFGIPRKTRIEDFGVIQSGMKVHLTDTDGEPVGDALVLGEDYELSQDGDGYCEIAPVLGGAVFPANPPDNSPEVTVALQYECVEPSGVTSQDICGSTVDGMVTGIRTIKNMYRKLHEVPALLLAPKYGTSKYPAVIAALRGASYNINGVFSCNTLADIDCGPNGARTYEQVADKKDAAGMTDYGMLPCWPMARIGDDIYPLSTVLAGQMNYLDAESGAPCEIISNRGLPITGFCLEDGTPVDLDMDEANAVRGYGICTGLFWDGAWRAWGAYTGAYPANTDPGFMYYNVDRFMRWDSNNFALSYWQYVDRKQKRLYIDMILDQKNDNFRAMKAKGWCPIGNISYPDEENPVEDVVRGIVNLAVEPSAYVPMQQINAYYRYNYQAMIDELRGG